MASTSSHGQAYGLLRVRDPQTRARISELAGNQAMVRQAGAFFVVLLVGLALRGLKQPHVIAYLIAGGCSDDSPNTDEPSHANPSHLDSHDPLPAAYWGTRSGLHCLDSVVASVWEEAYSHHITRLMVLSNLATLLKLLIQIGHLKTL